MTMMVYMVAHKERMLKLLLQIQIINIRITLDHCKMIINPQKSLQMLIIMVIMPIKTAHKPPVQLTRPGEVPTQMFL